MSEMSRCPQESLTRTKDVSAGGGVQLDLTRPCDVPAAPLTPLFYLCSHFEPTLPSCYSSRNFSVCLSFNAADLNVELKLFQVGSLETGNK